MSTSTTVPTTERPTIPLHRERINAPAHKKLATFDLETRGKHVGDALYGDIAPHGICLYGNAHRPDEPYPHFFATLEDFLAHLLESYAGFTIAAHNGSGYEWNYLLDPLRALVGRDSAYSVTTSQQGGAIIGYTLIHTTTAVVSRGKNRGKVHTRTRRWVFLDTLPLFNMPLADVATAFCPHLPKLEQINWKLEDWSYDNPAHRDYLMRDCQIVYYAYRALEALLYETFRASPGRTAGGTALHAFAASIPEGHVYYRSTAKVEKFVRRAYRGGLVLPGTTTKPQSDVALLDMSGAYGYQMLTHTYPVGAPCHTYEYIPGRTGVYSCYVTTPENLPFGIIAAEHDGGYPLGSFNAVCTSVEMEYAMSLGYTFEVYDGYYWSREEPVFVPFVEACQALEQRPRMKPLAKLVRNALYGKFCARTQGERFYLLGPDEPQPVGSYVILNPKTGEEVPGLYSMPETIDEPYMMPIWGVLITAYERVYLAERALSLYQAGAPSVYADTDSLAASRAAMAVVEAQGLFTETTPTGAYGGWKVEQVADTFMVAAPKVYVLLDAAGNILRSRAKGIPLKQLAEHGAVSPKAFRAGARQQHRYVSAHSITERLKHPELPIRLERMRRISDMAESPGWSYDPRTGRITPKVIHQVRRPHPTTPVSRHEDAEQDSPRIASA